MNKKLLILLALALIALPMAAACARVLPSATTVPGPKIPHAIDVRFENCNACHVADQLKATSPLPHTGMKYTNASCISPACHEPVSGTVTTTTTTPPTSPTGTETGTGTGTTSTTTSGGGTLPPTGVAITFHNLAQMTSYASMCLVCHGPTGSNPQPYAPSWNATASSSTHNTGTFTVAAGSPADHTGYAIADCTKAGCHTAPTS